MRSLDLAFDALRQGGASKEGGWNLLMTLCAICFGRGNTSDVRRDHLHLIPRSAPSFPLPSLHEPLEVNALGYAGMLLVRSEEEEQVLLEATEKDRGLTQILRSCGVPREWGEMAMKGRDAQREMIEDLA
jgi:ATP adenylyltransferase